MTDKQTTKKCPVCGNTNLGLLGRYNMKICVDHNPYVRIPWYVEEGQTALFKETTQEDEL